MDHTEFWCAVAAYNATAKWVERHREQRMLEKHPDRYWRKHVRQWE